MRRRIAGLSLLLLSMLGSTVCAQPVRRLDSTVRFTTLTSDIPQAAPTDSVREIRVRWTATPGGNAPAAVGGVSHAFSLVEQHLSQGPLPRERRPELSSDQLVVVVLAAEGTVLDWRLVHNPRLVRSESPGPGGVISGSTIEFQNAELSLTVADVPGARTLRIYQPRWTGTEFMLDAVGELTLTQ